MSLDGFMATLAVIIALYALAQPVERKAVWLFFPQPVFWTALLVSILILLFRTGVNIYSCKLLLWSDFLTSISPFVIPVSTLVLVVVSWRRAKISNKNMTRFVDFIKACRNEQKFDELIRIVSKNDLNNFSEKALVTLFQADMVSHLNREAHWYSLSWLSRIKNFQEKNFCSLAVTNVMRDMVYKDKSPLKKYIAAQYGGIEPLMFSDEERLLVESTFVDPDWYMKVYADKPLLQCAIERIDSGLLDQSYNSVDNLYINSHGTTIRIDCPVYLFIQTHTLMIQSAISDSVVLEDYYVSELSDIFQRILLHFKYEESVWNDPQANREYPTPYFYLLKKILLNIRESAIKLYKSRNNNLGKLRDELILIWSICLFNLAHTEKTLPPNFTEDSFSRCFEFLITLHDKVSEDDQEAELWLGSFQEEFRQLFHRDSRFIDVKNQSFERIDTGKYNISNNLNWLNDFLVYR